MAAGPRSPELAADAELQDRSRYPSEPSSSLWKRRSLQNRPSLAIAAPKGPVTMPSNILTDNFVIVKMLGQGCLSTVHHAVRKSDGEHFAVKVVASNDEEIIQVVAEEYEMLRRFDHPNIVRAHDLLIGPFKAVLVLDLIIGSDLETAVHQHPQCRFSEATTKPLARMLLSAVHYLHEHRVVHRDIKPQNVLVDNELTFLKLADFNVARCLKESGALTPTGTQLYAAPEVVLGVAPPNERSDVWSSGMCVYFMLSGKLPQRRDRDSCCQNMGAMRAAAERPIVFKEKLWEGISQPCIAMLQQALTLEWTVRMASMVLLQCVWFQQADDDSCQLALRKARSLCIVQTAAVQKVQQRFCHGFLKGGAPMQRCKSMPYETAPGSYSDEDERTSVCSDFGHALDSDDDLLDVYQTIWSRQGSPEAPQSESKFWTEQAAGCPVQRSSQSQELEASSARASCCG